MKTRYEDTEEYLIMRQIEQEEQMYELKLQNKYYYKGWDIDDEEDNKRHIRR